MVKRIFQIRRGMHKQLIAVLFLFFSIAAHAQDDVRSWPPVFYGGEQIGFLYDTANAGFIGKDLYMIDTLLIFSEKIAIHSPVSIRGDEYQFAPDWIAEAEDDGNGNVWVKFYSSISGDMSWLKIAGQGNRLYINEELVFMMNSSYDHYLAENDLEQFRALGIFRKKECKPVNDNVIVFKDHFDIGNGGFKSYHCPKSYSVEECLCKMDVQYIFKPQDYYDAE